MATTEVGDWQIPTLTVSVFDGTTSATLTVVAPDGTTATPAATSAGGGATWTAAGYAFTMPGEWVERWTVVGTGKGQERRVILVSPDPTDVPSGQRVYATTADYAKWLRAAPPAGSRLALAQASAAIDDMLLTSIYDTDPVTGLPTAADVIAALRDATCEQAKDARIAKAAAAGSFTIGSVSVTKSAPQKVREEDYRSPRAWAILQRAQLTGIRAWAW